MTKNNFRRVEPGECCFTCKQRVEKFWCKENDCHLVLSEANLRNFVCDKWKQQ